MTAAVAKLLRGLEEAGCSPRELYQGVWIATCPTCLLRGCESLIEIRAGAPTIVTCLGAHESPADVERFAA